MERFDGQAEQPMPNIWKMLGRMADQLDKSGQSTASIGHPLRYQRIEMGGVIRGALWIKPCLYGRLIGFGGLADFDTGKNTPPDSPVKSPALKSAQARADDPAESRHLKSRSRFIARSTSCAGRVPRPVRGRRARYRRSARCTRRTGRRRSGPSSPSRRAASR